MRIKRSVYGINLGIRIEKISRVFDVQYIATNNQTNITWNVNKNCERCSTRLDQK